MVGEKNPGRQTERLQRTRSVESARQQDEIRLGQLGAEKTRTAKAAVRATYFVTSLSVRYALPFYKYFLTLDDACASLARGEGRVITQESTRQLASEVKERGRARLLAKLTTTA